MSADLSDVRAVADAVLYEGYVLYPYRASAQKNKVRWQWGVLMPRPYAEAQAEAWRSVTEVLIEPSVSRNGEGTRLQVAVRFLQVQRKQVEARGEGGGFTPVESLTVGDDLLSSWDEGVEHEVAQTFDLEALLGQAHTVQIAAPGSEALQPIDGGRIVRRCWPLTGHVRVTADRLDGPYGVVRLRVETENTSSATAAGRDEALHHALVAAHTLLGLEHGMFLSLLDHPEWAAPAVAELENTGLWPVLVGEDGSRDLLLASPIILGDYPQIAPESVGDLYDNTEIDEILTLRTMALTAEEKREALGTDPRAAEIINRVDHLPPELLDRLHGTIRSFRETTGREATGREATGREATGREATGREATGPAPTPVGSPAGPIPGGPPAAEGIPPWWDPGMDASVSPETDSVRIGDTAVKRGSRVRLRPGLRRTDAQDMFLAGREAQVEAVLLDVDDNHYLAVTLADDPGADLYQWHGRFLYFHPDEVEAL